MKVVSVINYKGGVGKTTLVSNLAAYAASQGKRVLMIDLDPQMSLTLSFITDIAYWRNNYAKSKTIRNFFSAVLDGKTQPDLLTIAIDVTDPAFYNDGKLNLISSHLELIDTDIELVESIASAKSEIFAKKFLKCYNQLRIALAKVRDNYDLVMLDCPPNFYALVKNAITASDYYIIPAKMDYLSTLGIEHLQDKFKKYVRDYNSKMRTYLKNNPDGAAEYQAVKAELLGVVPTMIVINRDGPIKAQADYIKQLRDQKFDVFKNYIRHNATIFGAAPTGGVPVVLTYNRADVTWRKIIKPELEALGQEFIELAGI